jgi:hypothetical protein
VLNGHLTGLLQDIFFHFLNLYAPGALLVHWSMLAFFMALISYLHVLVVLTCMFVLLQFARLGFCSRDWKSLVPGGWLLFVPFFVVCCLLLLDSTLQGSCPTHALGPFGAFWLGSYLVLFLVCPGFAMLGCCIRGCISGYIFLHFGLHRILLR